jgi:molecular chaperone DnaK (HSP70)
MPSQPDMAVGLDLGAEKAMTVLASGELIRNELGGVGSASVVAFSGRERLIGEAGVQQLAANAANSVTAVHTLAGAEHASWSQENGAQHRSYSHAADPATGSPAVTVNYCSEQRTFSGTVLLAALLAKLRANLSTAKGAAAAAALPAAIVAPAHITAAQQRALVDAARIADFPGAHTFPAAACAAAVFARKHPLPAGAPPRTLLIVDIGSTQSGVFVIKFIGGDQTEVLAAAGVAVGAGACDLALFDHFRAQVSPCVL